MKNDVATIQIVGDHRRDAGTEIDVSAFAQQTGGAFGNTCTGERRLVVIELRSVSRAPLRLRHLLGVKRPRGLDDA